MVGHYFYHCTINTADILRAGVLTRGNSLYQGERGISFFFSHRKPLANTPDRYYNAPDARDATRLGESCFPISGAFCFESGGLASLFPARLRSAERSFDVESGLMKKGASEYLFPADLRLTREHCFWGIRIPSGYPQSKLFYNRTIAALFILNLPNVRVAYGDNNFYNAHTKFYLARPRLTELALAFVWNAVNLALVDAAIADM